jgi:hypothetical protein
MGKKEKIQVDYEKQKIEGLQGILYRLKMIYYLAYLITNPSHNKLCIGSDKIPGVSFALERSPLESFLTHIRALNEFIVKLKINKKQKDDLRTCCYLGINEAENFKILMKDYLLTNERDGELDAINKQLSHITTSDELINDWSGKIPSMRDRFFHIFREFIKKKVINELIVTVDRWNDPEYREIREQLEDSRNYQKDININNKADFFHATAEKYQTVLSLASSTGASPLTLNADQTNDNNEKLKSKTHPNNKE